MNEQAGERMNDLADEQPERRVVKRLAQTPPRRKKRPKNSSGINLRPLSKPKVLPEDVETANPEGGFTPWQSIIWREWCRSKDPDYNFYLFELVKSSAFGQNFVIVLALMGTLLGMLLGYLMGSMFDTSALQNVGPWNLSGLPVLLLTLTMGLAGGTIGLEGSRRFRTLYFWWQGQPTAGKVDWALEQAIAHHPEAAPVWAEPLRYAQKLQEQDIPPAELITILQNGNWEERYAARRALLATGGEATAALQELAADRANPLWETAHWLLGGIEHETSSGASQKFLG